MQKVYLDSFIEKIDNIRDYIEHINIINQFHKTSKHIKSENLIKVNQHLDAFRKERKLFEYKAIIISIYGVLENTISEWIQIHVTNISNIVNDYSSLEEKFKINHFNLSIELISRITNKRRSKFDDINKEDILKKLNDSIINPNNYDLNKEAYIPSSGNITHGNIKESFRLLDIDLDFLKNTLHSEINDIDGLVRLRNQIAHGVEIVQVLAFSEVESYIKALETYMSNIFCIIDKKEIEYEFKHQSKIYIDETKGILNKGTVCIINIKDTEIKIGDRLFIEKGEKVSKNILLGIQDNGKEIKSAYSGEFGLKFEDSITNNSKIWKKELNK